MSSSNTRSPTRFSEPDSATHISVNQESANRKRSSSPVVDNTPVKHQRLDTQGEREPNLQQYMQRDQHSQEHVSSSHKRRARRLRSMQRRAEMDSTTGATLNNTPVADQQSMNKRLHDEYFDGFSTSSGMMNTEHLADVIAHNTDEILRGYEQMSDLQRDLIRLEQKNAKFVESLGEVAKLAMPADHKKSQKLQDMLDAQIDENKLLQRDMADLKLQVATFSRMPGQVAEAELKDQMEDIWQQAFSWIGTHFRKLKTVAWKGETLPKLSESSKVLLEVHLHNLPDSSHLELLDIGYAIMAGQLKRILNDHYFGLSNDGKAGHIFQLIDAAKVGEPDYEEWRARTAERLNQVNSPALREVISNRAAYIRENIDQVFRELFGVEKNDVRLCQLSEIIDQCIKLGHLCAAQRAQYRFVMWKVEPRDGIQFRPDRMTDIFGFGSDPTDLQGNVVKFMAFPGLFKYEGKKLVAIITKARVICRSSARVS